MENRATNAHITAFSPFDICGHFFLEKQYGNPARVSNTSTTLPECETRLEKRGKIKQDKNKNTKNF